MEIVDISYPNDKYGWHLKVVVSYLNDKYDWHLKSEDFMKFRIEGNQMVLVVNRGIKGCPKFRIDLSEIDSYLESIEEKEQEKVALAIFTTIPGVTEKLQEALWNAGILDYNDLRFAIEEGDLSDRIHGLGPVTLQRIKDCLEVG